MSYWEIFTWLTVIMLGIGSIAVFMFFVKDIRFILEKFKKGKNEL
mgnify:FL=1|tara:strand:- start:143 stop:277 length:135 start_codon:yes stop_codon:yes gene_type:complete